MWVLTTLLACGDPAERVPAAGGGDRDSVARPDGDTAADDTAEGVETGETADTDTGADTDTDTAIDTGPVVWSCAPPEPADTASCAATLESSDPADGAVGVDPRRDVVFLLAWPDPAAAATVDGARGTSTVDGRRVLFAPAEPLAGDTDHVARLCACGEETTIRFRTGPTPGTPVADPTTLAGRTWSVDLSSGRLAEPAGLEVLLSAYMTSRLLLEVEGADATGLALRWGWSDPAAPALAQDVCAPTTDATAGFSTNPSFSAGPTAGWFPNLAPTKAEDVTVRGTFFPDGTVVSDVAWSGLVHTGPWAALIDPAAPGAFCDLLPPLGASCQACADGSPLCLRLVLDELQGVEVSPLPIATVPDVCPAPGDTGAPPDDGA